MFVAPQRAIHFLVSLPCFLCCPMFVSLPCFLCCPMFMCVPCFLCCPAEDSRGPGVQRAAGPCASHYIFAIVSLSAAPQKTAEDLEYSELLDQAAELAPGSVERLLRVAAFAVR